MKADLTNINPNTDDVNHFTSNSQIARPVTNNLTEFGDLERVHYNNRAALDAVWLL
jgi:hypothetical protein